MWACQWLCRWLCGALRRFWWQSRCVLGVAGSVLGGMHVQGHRKGVQSGPNQLHVQ